MLDTFEALAADIRIADDDAFIVPTDIDALLDEVGLPIHAIREIRGYAPGSRADG